MKRPVTITGVTVTGLGTLSPEMGASVALSNTSVDTCEDMDVTEDMEDIVLMALFYNFF